MKISNLYSNKVINRKKGITLIALVVTIIVLLILVAVSITLVLGPDGIVEKAREGSAANRYGSIKDKIMIRNTELEVNTKILSKEQWNEIYDSLETAEDPFFIFKEKLGYKSLEEHIEQFKKDKLITKDDLYEYYYDSYDLQEKYNEMDEETKSALDDKFDFDISELLEDLNDVGEFYDNPIYVKIILGGKNSKNSKYVINIVDETIAFFFQKEEVSLTDILDGIEIKIPQNNSDENDNMALIIATTKPNEKFTLPISNTNGLKINWDVKNNPNQFATSKIQSYPFNIYENPGEYEIQIKGIASEGATFGEEFWKNQNELVTLHNELYLESSEYKNISDSLETFKNSLDGDYEEYKALYIQKYKMLSEEKYDKFANKIVELKNWGKNKFSNCYSFKIVLRGSIPNLNENSFVYKEGILKNVFHGCINLTGEAPKFWEEEYISNIQDNPPIGRGSFDFCYNLTNLNEIPLPWVGWIE